MISLLHKIGLTKQEMIIIGFLLLVFVTGVILRLLSWSPQYTIDYSSRDKIFKEKIKSAYTKLPSTELTTLQKEKLIAMNILTDSLLLVYQQTQTNSKQHTLDRKININTAYSSDLVLLPGVGKVMAERITEFREERGRFNRIEDLMRVKGIGEKKFEKLKNYITVEP